MRRNIRFLRLCDLLNIDQADARGQREVVGMLHDLWSHVYEDGVKRYDTLDDLRRATGLPADFLNAMASKDVAWIRQVKPTAAEQEDRMERGYSPSQALKSWQEVRTWNVKTGSGERKTDRNKQTGQASDQSPAQDVTTSSGLAKESDGRPMPTAKADESKAHRVANQIAGLQAAAGATA